jgi:hypothetical protein
MSAPPPPLVQLNRRFTSACPGLNLSVQTTAEGWVARVSDSRASQVLYSAYRCNLSAAQNAAAEFVALRAGFWGQLAWTENSGPWSLSNC